MPNQPPSTVPTAGAYLDMWDFARDLRQDRRPRAETEAPLDRRDERATPARRPTTHTSRRGQQLAHLMLTPPHHHRHHGFMSIPLEEHSRAWIVVALLGTACGVGEGLPDIEVTTIGHHDKCSSEPFPYSVDASSSEIQCLIVDHKVELTATEIDPPTGMHIIIDEPGDPICCEVCAKKGTADQACEDMCNWQACDRARDDHKTIGEQLGFCTLPTCGFDFELCMQSDNPHLQAMTFIDETFHIYLLEARCEALAMDPARPDGLFEYIEELDGIPNAGGMLADITDVANWCISVAEADTSASATGNISISATAGGDGMGVDTTAGDTEGGDASPGEPVPCGHWAGMRTGPHPSNNFGTWNQSSGGVGLNDTSSYSAVVTDGGIEYSVFPCNGASQECLRIDRLSVRLEQSNPPIVVDLNLRNRTSLMPISAIGTADIPIDTLEFEALYKWNQAPRIIQTSNTKIAHATIDITNGTIELIDLEASSNTGDLVANLSLYGDLVNTQPRPEILVSPGSSWNEITLSAQTIDAEIDPIVHHWMVMGHGTWSGDSVTLSLPEGRHAVVLYADDVHESRGISATWVDIAQGATP